MQFDICGLWQNFPLFVDKKMTAQMNRHFYKHDYELLHSLFNSNCTSNSSTNHGVVAHAMSKKFTVTRNDLQ